MNQIFEEISKIGIIPVVVIDNASDAIPLADALSQGGLNCAEITFRTAAAEDSLRIISSKFPEIIAGAGTVLTVEQAEKAYDSGAKFIVAPGFNPKIAEYCIKKSIPFAPGVMTPSEVSLAVDYGFDVLKFFPAEISGGVNMLKTYQSPFSNVKFIPTGGINAENLREYLECRNVLACGGSWMVKQNLIMQKNFYEIKNLAAQAVKTVCSVREK